MKTGPIIKAELRALGFEDEGLLGRVTAYVVVLRNETFDEALQHENLVGTVGSSSTWSEYPRRSLMSVRRAVSFVLNHPIVFLFAAGWFAEPILKWIVLRWLY